VAAAFMFGEHLGPPQWAGAAVVVAAVAAITVRTSGAPGPTAVTVEAADIGT
jgi:drug/metabolite transporter (DMT)-like permease